MSICLQEISHDDHFLTPPSLASPGKPFVLSKGAIYKFCKKYDNSIAFGEKCA